MRRVSHCPEPYEIRGADVRLIVHAIDLAATMDDLENQVAAVGFVMGLHGSVERARVS